MNTVTVVNNDKYHLAFNSSKNRVHLRIIGFWKDRKDVSDYLKDWKKTLGMASPGFTLLTDATAMKAHPLEVKQIHERALTLALKAGVKKAAEVQKDGLCKMQLDDIAARTRFPKRNFSSVSDAEQWLDQR